MYGQLLPLGGGDPIPLLKTELLVGRRESCDIVLRFANVSAHHCQLDCIEASGIFPGASLRRRRAFNIDPEPHRGTPR